MTDQPKRSKGLSRGFYYCECGMKFESEDELLEHQKLHDEKPNGVSAQLVSEEDKQSRIEKGEQGQTQEERRAWQHVQRKEQEEEAGKR
jgi:hypothetical protein